MISEFVATQQNRLDVEANHAHTHESVDARWVVIAAGGLDQVSWEQARRHDYQSDPIYYASNFITGSLWKAGTFVLVLAWDPWTQAIAWYITRTTLLEQGRKRWQKSRITFISFAHFKFFEGPNWKETTVYSPLCAGWAQWAALAVTQT